MKFEYSKTYQDINYDGNLQAEKVRKPEAQICIDTLAQIFDIPLKNIFKIISHFNHNI